MIKILAAFIGVLIAVASYSQDKNDEYKTIFGDDPSEVSGFGGFDMQFSSLGGNFALGAGGSGGVLINNQIAFGGFGMGSTLDNTYEVDNNTYKNTSIGVGGLMLGYILNSKSPIHPSFFLQTGWGGVNLSDNNRQLTDNVFVLNPSVKIELNFTRYFKMAIGAHYQFTMGVNKFDALSNSDFSGPGGNLSFIFGWFN